jgi:hypothetical protein
MLFSLVMHVAVMQRTGPKTAVSLLELDRNAVTAAAAGSGGGALVQPPRFAAPSRPVYELDASTGVVSSSRHPFRPEGQCVCVCVCVYSIIQLLALLIVRVRIVAE